MAPAETLARFGAQVMAGSGEVAGPDGRVLAGGDRLRLAGTTVDVVPTPGHCSDHLAFRLESGAVLVGDRDVREVTGFDRVMAYRFRADDSGDIVAEELDLSAILSTYDELRGYPPYHPGMMVALLLYGYSRGLYSSRQLARACEERVDVMAVTGLNRPDFRTIADFRKRHLVALSDLFVQVLRLCQAAGLVQFAHVAVDGTKVKANASRHKAMSYGRMKTAEPALAAEVEAWLALRRAKPIRRAPPPDVRKRVSRPVRAADRSEDRPFPG